MIHHVLVVAQVATYSRRPFSSALLSLSLHNRHLVLFMIKKKGVHILVSAKMKYQILAQIQYHASLLLIIHSLPRNDTQVKSMKRTMDVHYLCIIYRQQSDESENERHLYDSSSGLPVVFNTHFSGYSNFDPKSTTPPAVRPDQGQFVFSL